MDIDPARLSTALSDLYGAAADPASRDLLPQNLAKAFDATSCLLHIRDVGSKAVTIVGATDNVQVIMPEYAKHYHARDLWAARAGGQHVGHAMIGEDLVPERELIDAEWYYDLCRPYGIHHLVGAAFEVEQQVQGQIGVHRARDARAFETRDRMMLNLLIPHLQQAYRLMRIADRDARTGKLTSEALGALSVAVLVVGAAGQVRMMNAACERLLRLTPCVTVKNGRLRLADPKLEAQLQEGIRRASLAPLGKSLSAGANIVVPVAEGDSLLLMITPLPAGAGGPISAEPLAAILIGDPSHHAEPSADLIKVMYGLTVAETRVLMAIVKGQSLREYAQQAGVSINTAHSQAKSVFAKTGCRRQTDLVNKVLHRPILRIARLLRESG